MSRRTRTVSASSAARGSGAQDGVRAGLLRNADELFAGAPELTDHPPADRWAFRYLESSRRLGQVPPAMSPTEQHKLVAEQADMLVGVIWAVLDGLGLSDEDWERGRQLAEKALQAVVEEGWGPL